MGQFPPGEEEEGPNNSLQHRQEEITPQASPVARPLAPELLPTASAWRKLLPLFGFTG